MALLSLLKIEAACGRVRALDRGSVENNGDERTSIVVTDFLGVSVFVREDDLSEDFFTKPVRLSREVRGSVTDDDDKLPSLSIHWFRSLHVQCIILSHESCHHPRSPRMAQLGTENPIEC